MRKTPKRKTSTEKRDHHEYKRKKPQLRYGKIKHS